MKFLVPTVLALCSTILGVSSLQCYHCGDPFSELLPTGQCPNVTSPCRGGNTTCITVTRQDLSNQTLMAKGCALPEDCNNQKIANLTNSCMTCLTDFCNSDRPVTPSNETISTTTAAPTTSTSAPTTTTSTTVKPALSTVTAPKMQPTKKKNIASTFGGSLAVLITAVVVLLKVN